MLGRAVSSSTPTDFQPSSVMGWSEFPLMNRQATRGLRGWPYAAVGMQRALHSAIGLPRRPTRASWMLGFLMPADVRRHFTAAPVLAVCGGVLIAARSGRIS